MMHSRSLVLLAFALFAFAPGCPKKSDRPDTGPPPPPPPPASSDRVPAVPSDHPLYDRVEGADFANACTSDAQCVKAGCSSEVCAAEDVTTTCEMPAEGFPPGAAGKCGCVSGECIWYTTTTEATPGRGEPCPEGRCAEGVECVEYYGVAGTSGPKLSSCEIRCDEEGAKCPDEERCVTIMDGPGRVCRR